MRCKRLFMGLCGVILSAVGPLGAMRGEEPKQGSVMRALLGNSVALETVYIPPGEFMMGSTAEEKSWATGIEGGAQAGTERESYEGKQPRPMHVKYGFWMGRTEVTVDQFKQFVDATGYKTDAEKSEGKTQCFNPNWKSYHLTTQVTHPWEPMAGKSWRDPNFQFPIRPDFPVVCVSWIDGRAFGQWLTKHERAAGRLPEDLEYRLPTEAEWEYACRGGSHESNYFWWGNELSDGEGRFNISAVDFLPDRKHKWPLASAPWSDGFAFVAPVDHFGDRGRNGFGMADMCGNVWEVILDHFDPKGGHEDLNIATENYRPVCRGGNYFDVPGNARCAVRLGLAGPNYSDSRDGFRICLGPPRNAEK